MQITFDEKKRLDTNPIFHLFVQGENMAESIRIVGPKMVGALDLSQLRMAVRVTSAAYETMVEKTLEQTVSDEGTITLVWNVDRQFTSNPGHVQVMLVGYGNNEEVIKITSSGIEVKEDETFISAPQGNTWEQILREMQDLATQARTSQTDAAASATKAAASEQVAIYKAEQTAANAKAADTSATLSESWAVGGTGTREGENTNNAQYWAQQAQSIADGQVDLSNYYTKAQADAAFATAAQGAKADTAVQSVNGKTGTAVTLDPQDVGGLSTYTCATSGTTHALTGTGNNIKFVADAAYNEGDTITVNGQVVTAQTQDGAALVTGAWASGATVVCWLNGTTLTVSGGGGSYTPPSYSTDEVLTGESWIDGKPIYKKVWHLGALSAGNYSVPKAIDIDTPVAYGGVAKLSRGDSWPIPSATVSGGTNLMISASTFNHNPEHQFIVTVGDGFTGETAITSVAIWVEYTKP